MPIETPTGYVIKCLNCNYSWKTKYPKIPAKCPSCNKSIHNSKNYEIKTHFIHSEPTVKEIEEREKQRAIAVLKFGFIAISFTILIIMFGFWISLGLCMAFIVAYYLVKNEKPKKKKETFKVLDKEHCGETINVGKKQKHINIICPNCNSFVEKIEMPKVNKKKKLEITCKRCKKLLTLEMRRKKGE